MDSLPLEWVDLSKAWSAGEDISSRIADIPWNRPAIAWEEGAAGNVSGRLVHPLSLVFRLEEPALARLAIEHVLSLGPQEESLDLKTPSLSPGSPGGNIPLPPMSNLWDWGVLESAIKANDWAAAGQLLPHVARSNQDHRFGHLACSLLCKQLATIENPKEFLGLWRILSSPETTNLEARFLAGIMLTKLAIAGSPAVVEAFVESESAGFVDMLSMAHLAHRELPGLALRLARLAEEKNDLMVSDDSSLEDWVDRLSSLMEGPQADQAANHVAWLSETQPSLQQALTDPQASPAKRSGSWSVIAHAVLQASPGRFDSLLERSKGPSQAVLVEWSQRVPPSDSRVSPWLERYRHQAGPDIRRQAVDAILRKEHERVVMGPSVDEDTHSDFLVSHLALWSDGLGVDFEEVKESYSLVNHGLKSDSGLSPVWRRALARFEARKMEERLPLPAPTHSPRFRV